MCIDMDPLTPCPETDIAGIDEDGCPLVGGPSGISCDRSFWLYEESNGIPGLQRQNEVQDDTCGGQIVGDTIIF